MLHVSHLLAARQGLEATCGELFGIFIPLNLETNPHSHSHVLGSMAE